MVDPYVAALEAEIASLRGQIAGLEQARDLYLRQSPTAAASMAHVRQTVKGDRAAPVGVRPSKNRQITFELLRQHRDGLTSRELNDLIQERDPTINAKSITSFLSVAARNGLLERDEFGRYRLPGASPQAAGAEEVGAADTEPAAVPGFDLVTESDEADNAAA